MVPNMAEECVLSHIQEVTLIPHRAQEALSSERTPTLSYSLPFYHSVILKWRDLEQAHPLLAPYIEVGVMKVEEYVGKSKLSRTYLLAVCLLLPLPSLICSGFHVTSPSVEPLPKDDVD